MNASRKSGSVLIALGLIAGLSLGTRAAVAEDKAEDKPEAIVKYRHNVMAGLGKHMASLGMILKGEVGFKDQMQVHADGLNALSPLIPKLFPAGTGPDKVKTDTRPVVWKEWDKFKAASVKMDEETAKLVAVTKSGDMEAIKAQFAAVGKACGSCHDTYRVED